jgi:CheY-like chemotaxis protein
MTVFYAEDDSEDQEIFKAALSELHPEADVLLANNGIDALNLLQKLQQTPEIIFLDMNMPIMNGSACVSALKTIDRFKTTPIILYSTTSNPLEIEKGMAAGADRFLIKANTFQEVINDVGHIIKTYVA